MASSISFIGTNSAVTDVVRVLYEVKPGQQVSNELLAYVRQRATEVTNPLPQAVLAPVAVKPALTAPE